MRRDIPYGVINWEDLVRDCYVVDNTGYIRELERCRTPVFLRPKRFGKSIVCSMLEYYYDVNRKDRFQELFGRFDIGKDPMPLANSFLVLKFDFSTIQVGTVAEIERDFLGHVKECVSRFTTAYAHLADWSPVAAAPTAAATVDAVISLDEDKLGMIVFTEAQVRKYVVEVCSRRGYNWFEVAEG